MSSSPSVEQAIAERIRPIRWFVVAVAVVFLGAMLIIGLQNGPRGTPIVAGRKIAPFAVPLALGTLNGAANLATHAHDGELGERPACSVRGPQILNVCELYERRPLVLALFVNASTCPRILGELQTLARSFPAVQFAAVAVKGDRQQLRSMLRSSGVSVLVGFDEDGELGALYQMVDCPELTFALPYGVAASGPLLGQVSLATLRARVAALLAAARRHGWRPRPA